MDLSNPIPPSNPSLFLIPDKFTAELFAMSLTKMAGLTWRESDVAEDSTFYEEIIDLTVDE